MVKHLLLVQWVMRSIPNGGPIKLFLIPATTGIIKAVVYIVLSVGWCI